MKWIVLSGAFLICACSDPAAKAEKQYNIAAQMGSPKEKCEAARKVAGAYGIQSNEPKYGEWKKRQDADCRSAKLPHG